MSLTCVNIAENDPFPAVFVHERIPVLNDSKYMNNLMTDLPNLHVRYVCNPQATVNEGLALWNCAQWTHHYLNPANPKAILCIY